MTGEASSPMMAVRKNFDLFAKRTVSDETIQAEKPGRDAVYQARWESSKEIDQIRHQTPLDSGRSTPRTSTNSTPVRESPRSEEEKLAPTRLQLNSGGGKKSVNSIKKPRHSFTTQDNDQTPRKTTVFHSPKIRQSSLGLDGFSRFSNKRFTTQHNYGPSWIGDRRMVSNEIQQRRQSELFEAQSEAIRRASMVGAKPVAPSYHPDAPSELKVKSPRSAVLLPFLSIPANEKESKDKEEILLSPSPDFHAESVMQSTKIKHQRPNIKVRIITWNQGASVPKGDLEVLLGKVGEYIAPQECWDESSDEDCDKKGCKPKHRGMGVAGQEKTPRKDRIPPLPHDDAHPYHIVIVAGQECPWGDGKRIATGVGLAGELGDLSRSKSRATKEKEKRDAQKREEEGKISEEKMIATAHDGEYPFADHIGTRNVPSTPAPTTSVPSTPGGASIGGAWGIGGKGWSDMCEDWLCRGPLAQATATKGLAQASKGVNASPMILSPAGTPETSVTPAESRSNTPLPGLGLRQETYAAMSPQGQPSISTPSEINTETSPNKAISRDHHYPQPLLKNRNLAVPIVGRSISPASRSKDKLEISNPSTADNGGEELSSSPLSRPLSPIKQAIDVNSRLPAHLNRQQSIPGKGHHRLGLHIPGLSASHHVTVQSDGTPFSLGAYELVAKERCYMMYMAVYVWRGCLDRVSKTSQGHVKSGLLAGRVGNKGAVGISLKLGITRLLFVNAHLAAHEGKVAERIANVEKIKSELKVDTFLPPDDPRNQAEDVTEAFDYAFWFGDLNFRVDISRQHADWLLMKKQYQDALAFDQLTKVRKEQPNVFKNFIEADIKFPPTFKYDVLKTIKHKREEKARRMTSSVISKQQNSSQNENMSLSTSQRERRLKESSSLTDISSMSQSRSQSATLVREAKEERTEDDTSSVSSSNWGSSAISTSAGHHSDQDELETNLTSIQGDSQVIPLDTIVSKNTAAAEGHAFHGKAIKIKRRILDAVYAIGSHSPHREKEGHLPHVLKAGRLIKSQSISRRNSNEIRPIAASMASHFDDGKDIELMPSKAPFKQHLRTESSNSLNDLTKSAASEGQNSKFTRRRSSLGETTFTSPTRKQQLQNGNDSNDNHNNNNDNNSDDVDKLQPSSSLSAMMEEYEKQPYDTSAKQRVPSWCDRVLWKSNVEVVISDGLIASNANTKEGSTSFHNRMTNVFSNAFTNDRRRWRFPEKRQSVFFASEQMPNRKQSRSIDMSLSTESGNFKVSSASTRATSPRHHWYQRKNSEDALRRSATFDHQRSSSASSKMPESSLDIDNGKERTSSFNLPLKGKTTSSSQSIPTLVTPRRKSENSFEASREKPSSSKSSPMLANSLPNSFTPDETSNSVNSSTRVNLNNEQHAIHFSDNRQLPAANGVPLSDSTTSNKNDNQMISNVGQYNRKSSWWNEFVGGPLSSLLTPLGTANNASKTTTSNNRQELSSTCNNEELEPEEELIGPHKGQIHCLLYKSLDDREMRLLEGRSDHRPVIWVGSIGV